MKINMKQYGLTDRFAALASVYDELSVGRVILQEKGMYHIITGTGEYIAEISGKFRYNAKTVSDYPVVGDFVMAEIIGSDRAVIHHILERKSSFVRKAAGTNRKEQVIAANIDTVFICMSLNNDYNLRRLERYLAIGLDSGANPVIVLTKSDLCNDTNNIISEIKNIVFGTDILVTTTALQEGYSQILPYITEGKTVAFIGSSGVGKSTLINCLLGENRLSTNGLRNDDKGRHTTTHRELILISDGGVVIDTPGMRELGMWDSDAGVDLTFADIEKLASQCKFKNCTHTNEKGCAVSEALEKGELSEERCKSYKKLKAEIAYAADSESYLAGKERKFKEIAKFNKKNKKGKF
ncbi:MAG: ribosome small subunit-dependent GTPase A [Clostridia bacterium]|nr:ribosome small subunit-dependent GTPase A [Clostridia bacterium]